MGIISNDNIIKFVVGLSGVGLSLATFTLTRLFTLEDYTHNLSEESGEANVRVQFLETFASNTRAVQNSKTERMVILETKISIIEEQIKELRAAKAEK